MAKMSDGLQEVTNGVDLAPKPLEPKSAILALGPEEVKTVARLNAKLVAQQQAIGAAQIQMARNQAVLNQMVQQAEACKARLDEAVSEMAVARGIAVGDPSKGMWNFSTDTMAFTPVQ